MYLRSFTIVINVVPSSSQIEGQQKRKEIERTTMRWARFLVLRFPLTKRRRRRERERERMNAHLPVVMCMCSNY